MVEFPVNATEKKNIPETSWTRSWGVFWFVYSNWPKYFIPLEMSFFHEELRRDCSEAARLTALFWREDVCDGPVHLSHLVSGAMRCSLPASQTMAAVCQMVASVSDSEMPTAIKNLLLENKSFNSGPIWWSEPLGLWSFKRPDSREKQMERTVRWDVPIKKGEEWYLILLDPVGVEKGE